MDATAYTADQIAGMCKNARPDGDGFKACCPAHDDNNPSLAISRGEDGRILLHCFAGCDTRSVVSALGISLADLMPGKGRPTAPAGRKSRSAQKYATAEAAIAAVKRRYGFIKGDDGKFRQATLTGSWDYYNSSGEHVSTILRIDGGGKKEYPCVSCIEGVWVNKAMPKPRPLFALQSLRENRGKAIAVAEGEKCAGILAGLGLLATTSSGGADAAGDSDWSPCAGRDVVIFPDAGAPGRRYRDKVIANIAALTPPPRIKVVELPGLADGEDVEQFLARGGTVESLRQLAKAAHAIELDTPDPAPEWAAFPTHLLPNAVALFVQETAAALGCDESMVALPVLTVLGGAIGTTRCIQLKESWRELAIIWSMLIAPSGSLKSPAHDAATVPLTMAEIRKANEHKAAIAAYRRELREFKKAGEAGDPPEAPIPVRFIVSDCTIEALAPILENNPRGLALLRDELSALVSGFNQYKAAGGADAAAWLELHRGGRLRIDRKTGEKRTIAVPRAAVSIGGTSQPRVMRETFQDEHWNSGLVARFLMAHPPTRKKRWTELVPSRETKDAYGRLVNSLLELHPVLGEDDEPEPMPLTVWGDARTAWATWYDRHAERQADASTDQEAAGLSKLEAYAARLALIFQLCHDRTATSVGPDCIRRGCAMADWFANEMARVYLEIGDAADEAPEDGARRKLVAFIERKGGSVSVRDLSRGPREFRTGAREALQALADAGVGTWGYPSPQNVGGRPSERFTLNGAGDKTRPDAPIPPAVGDDTPSRDSGNGGFGFVATKAASGKSPGEDRDHKPPADIAIVELDEEFTHNVASEKPASLNGGDETESLAGDANAGGFVAARGGKQAELDGFVTTIPEVDRVNRVLDWATH